MSQTLADFTVTFPSFRLINFYFISIFTSARALLLFFFFLSICGRSHISSAERSPGSGSCRHRSVTDQWPSPKPSNNMRLCQILHGIVPRKLNLLVCTYKKTILALPGPNSTTVLGPGKKEPAKSRLGHCDLDSPQPINCQCEMPYYNYLFMIIFLSPVLLF